MTFNKQQVEKWDVFEITLESDAVFENPFTQSEIGARFKNGDAEKEVCGFYDGGGVWKIRFMPEEIGEYAFTVNSNIDGLNGLTGSFISTEPSEGNRGPVRVYKKYHFAYADGTPFYVHGTSAYAWTTSSEKTRRETVASVAENRFNKLRMGFFPKRLEGQVLIDTTQDPPTLPYEGERGKLDLKRFRPDYFQRFEEDVQALLEKNIQADIILFHFYDFGYWGINPGLTAEEDLLYVRYIAARLSAYRNIWWCICNEYDLLLTPTSGNTHTVNSISTQKDWDAIGRQLKAADPYGHPRCIHNFTTGHIPDFEWMTHVGFQNSQTYELVLELKRKYGKPAIADEFGYEGNITGSGWGDRTPEHETECFVRAVMAGGYATHGESYIVDGNARDIFWAYGGVMVGESAPKLKLFREIMESLPFTEMEPEIAMMQGTGGLCLRKGVEIFLMFFRKPSNLDGLFLLTTDMRDEYDVTVYDLWNGTTEEIGTVKPGRVDIKIPEWAVVKVLAK